MVVIAMIRHTSLISRCVKNVQNDNIRCLSFKSLRKLISIRYRKSVPTTPTVKAPYDDICQIGDPVLRKKAELVDPKIIETEEFQKTVDRLYKVMKAYGAVGLAAPQIGLSLQLFAMEITEESLSDIHPYIRETCKMESHPLTYFVNPTMEIVNPEIISSPETCGSLRCYYAEVPRATEVRIKALNRFGEPFTWSAKYWTARVAQHEMDHLQGLMYTDRMYPFSFEYFVPTDMHKDDKDVAAH
ncbi:peptide deformylase, mitochondrial-like [Ceratina calcarata]|uniref:Peptide deformylase n=1 Tax=Ceratina calcarata TaxID=156304 RepID=A0AAJ7J2Z9_9HYME|nr:peptide deformylase, mitochondrial-like [Ceratina calcarata]